MRLVGWFGCVEGDSFMRTVGKGKCYCFGVSVFGLDASSFVHCHRDTGLGGFLEGGYCIDI